MEQNRTDFADEIRIIPWWAWVLAVAAFAGMQILMFFHLIPHGGHAHPALRGVWAVLAGIVIGAYFLMVGYVNRDAARRGMAHRLWTALLLVIPSAIWLIIYFIMRQPVQVCCPRCATRSLASFNFCPHCHFQFNPTCPRCQHGVTPGDVYCPYCGNDLSTAAGGVPLPAGQPPLP